MCFMWTSWWNRWNHCASRKWSLFMLFFFSWQDAKKFYHLPASNIVGNSERIYMELVNLSIHLFICVHIFTCIHIYILTYLYTFHSFHNNPILFHRFKKRRPIRSISITGDTPFRFGASLLRFFRLIRSYAWKTHVGGSGSGGWGFPGGGPLW